MEETRPLRNRTDEELLRTWRTLRDTDEWPEMRETIEEELRLRLEEA